MTINAQKLNKSYGGVSAVTAMDLTLNGGEILGLLGPNGAGKSTTLGMLYGLIVPDSGHVFIDDLDVSQNGREARSLLGIVSQDDNPDPDFTVEENITFFGRYYGLPKTRAASRALELISRFGLEEHRHKLPEELSGGLRKRLSLARALVGSPRYLFLDEPTTGLDPEARLNLWTLIVQLRDEGCGILLTTHYMDEAERLSDRVQVVHHGQIVAAGRAAALIEQHLGGEMIEIEGLSSDVINTVVSQHGATCRRYGTGFTISTKQGETDQLWLELARLVPVRMGKRQPNLEDLFLKLTGERLG